MLGRKQQFTVGEVTLTLARPSFSELTDLLPTLKFLYEDPEYEEVSHDISDILERAAEHESDEDKAALKSLSDAVELVELWDQWLAFSGLQKVLVDRSIERLEQIRAYQERQMLAMGATQEQIDAHFLRAFLGAAQPAVEVNENG